MDIIKLKLFLSVCLSTYCVGHLVVHIKTDLDRTQSHSNLLKPILKPILISILKPFKPFKANFRAN